MQRGRQGIILHKTMGENTLTMPKSRIIRQWEQYRALLFVPPSPSIGYIGKHLDYIKNLHKDKIINPEKTCDGLILLELRVTSGTLTFRLENDICTEAYLFQDRDKFDHLNIENTIF